MLVIIVAALLGSSRLVGYPAVYTLWPRWRSVLSRASRFFSRTGTSEASCADSRFGGHSGTLAERSVLTAGGLLR
jgi:hypothetical protein